MPRLLLNAQVLLQVSLAPGNHTIHKCTCRATAGHLDNPLQRVTVQGSMYSKLFIAKGISKTGKTSKNNKSNVGGREPDLQVLPQVWS